MYMIKTLSAVDGTVTSILECENLTNAIQTAAVLSLSGNYTAVRDVAKGDKPVVFLDGEQSSLPLSMVMSARGGYNYQMTIIDPEGVVKIRMPYLNWGQLNIEAAAISKEHPNHIVEIGNLRSKQVVVAYRAGEPCRAGE